MIVEYNTKAALSKQDNYASLEFVRFCSQLVDKLNNTSAITLSIDVEGDVNIDANNIQFYNSTWPIDEPGAGFVLHRDTTLAMSWEDPADLTLSPEVGKIELFFGATAPTGWILYNGGTIGNGASGGTTRANADTEDLFIYLWDLFNNTIAPVSSGRGASAAADFAANKTISLASLNARLLAAVGGGYSHMAKAGDTSYFLTAAMMPNHDHPTWYTEPLGAGVPIGAETGQMNQDNLGKTGSFTGSYWNDEVLINDGRYGPNGAGIQTFTEFSVAQPSVNVNIIIKL